MEIIVRRRLATVADIVGTSSIQNNFDFSDAAHLTLVSGKISAIQDTGVEALSLAQSVDNQRPFLRTNRLNGLSIAEFGLTNDGSTTDFLETLSSVTIPADFTIKIVSRLTSLASIFRTVYTRRSNSGAGITQLIAYNATNFHRATVQNSAGTNSGLDFNVLNTGWSISTFRNISGTLGISVNNSAFVTSASPVVSFITNPQLIRIGRNNNTVNNPLVGDIGQILVFNRGLTANENSALSGLLAHKWGLQSNLASSDFYRFLPPYI